MYIIKKKKTRVYGINVRSKINNWFVDFLCRKSTENILKVSEKAASLSEIPIPLLYAN